MSLDGSCQLSMRMDEPTIVPALQSQRIVKIASGMRHCAALSEDKKVSILS